MIRVELVKQLRRVRTWIGLGALIALPIIFTVANKMDPGRHRREQDAAGEFILRAATAGGFNVAVATLSFMSQFFLVIVVCMFAGDVIAGEAGWGTLRSLLVRPVGRSKLLRSKLAIVALLVIAATILIPLTGLISGTIAFGWHGIQRPFFGAMSIGESMRRLSLATAYVAWGLSGVIAFAVLLSTITDAAAGAIGGAIGMAIASQILDGITALRSLRYGLPTHYWSSWNALFVPNSPTADMWRGVALQVPYVLVFGAAAFWWFSRKDVLS